MHINWQLRELNLKIVYYGPAMSGKTTNLEKIHARVDPRYRSDLVSLKTHEDRTLFFDFLQLEMGKVGALTPKLHLYTVPGQTYYEASRKLVLRGADGVVFVVDSASDRLEDNLESWKSMRAHLTSMHIPVDQLPLVVQFNKQDLLTAMDPIVLKSMLPLNGHPTFNAIALQGEGVLDTLKAIVKSVLTTAQRELA
jgi:signal recognition particle receptor subunit beta